MSFAEAAINKMSAEDEREFRERWRHQQSVEGAGNLRELALKYWRLAKAHERQTQASAPKQYSASIEFFERGFASSLNIDYLATGHEDAVRSAIRFANNRAATFNWTFTALKVRTLTLKPIGESGDYQTRHGFDFFEWKIDRGGIDQHVEAFVAQLALRRISVPVSSYKTPAEEYAESNARFE